MVEVKWTEQAVLDIENIAEYIAKDSQKYAEIRVKRFFAAVKVLEKGSGIGRIVPELHNPQI